MKKKILEELITEMEDKESGKKFGAKPILSINIEGSPAEEAGETPAFEQEEDMTGVDPRVAELIKKKRGK